MESNFLENIDVSNLSAVSEGQVNPDNRLVDIQAKVREACEFAKINKNKSKKIRFEKIMPLLNNINAVSQHNYSVSQNLLIQNRHLQEKCLKIQEDLQRISDERDSLRFALEDAQHKSTIEMKLLSNDNERFQSLISNYRIENDMLKGLLQEKSEILASKDSFLNRLENQIQLLNNELHECKSQNEKDIETLVRKDSESQEKLRLLTLNLNTKECEIAKLNDLRSMEQKDAEKHLSESRNTMSRLQNQIELDKKRLENLDRAMISRELELENAVKSLKEFEGKLTLKEKEHEKTRKALEIKEKQLLEDIERRAQEKMEKFNDRVIDLEVKLADANKIRVQSEQKIEELAKECTILREELASQKQENQDIERKLQFVVEEKGKFLSDYNEVKNRYEKLVDGLERELKTLRTKFWETENQLDSQRQEIQRLSEKEKILSNLSKFKNENLESYLRLNVNFGDAYKEISPETLENVHQEAQEEIETLERSRNKFHNSQISEEAKSEDPLTFNDLDKEWELVNTALAGLNDKYRENLSFLQK